MRVTIIGFVIIEKKLISQIKTIYSYLIKYLLLLLSFMSIGEVATLFEIDTENILAFISSRYSM